jgi:hypothetical protein
MGYNQVGRTIGPSHPELASRLAESVGLVREEALMADYHYVSTWQLQAPIEPVWAALNDLEHLPAWYSGVQEGRELIPGNAQGVGTRVRYVIKGRLPLRLAFETTITRSVPPGNRSCSPRGSWPGPAAGCWTSRGVMLQAGEGLASFLGVPLVNAEFAAPAWSWVRRLGWAAAVG